MSEKRYFDRDDVSLKELYETGEINAEEFLEMLFSSNEADRKRRNIIKKNNEEHDRLVKA